MRRPASRLAAASTPAGQGSGRRCGWKTSTSARGALAYLAAYDVRRAKVIGRCGATTGIEPFDRLVEQVMTGEPYRPRSGCSGWSTTAPRTAGRPAASGCKAVAQPLVVHPPVHASWLNQIEIYFSVVQRKVLTPNDFASLEDLEQRLLAFQEHYEHLASPFQWKFTRSDLEQLLRRLQTHDS